MLRALARLERCNLPTFHAWFIGGTEEDIAPVRGSIRDTPELADAADMGRLMFWRRVAPEALPELYSRSTVVVMPSTQELFGLVAIEAMACATPVVASAVGGLKHVVLHRHSGLLFRPGDDRSLAWILMSLLINPCLSRSLADKASRWVRFAFDQDAIIERMTGLYDGLKLPEHAIQRPELFHVAERERLAVAAGITGESATIHSKNNLVIELGDETRQVCKIFADAPASDASNFALARGLVPVDRKVRQARVAFHAQNGTPCCVGPDSLTDAMAIYPRLQQHARIDDSAARDLAAAFARAMPPPPRGAVHAWREAFESLWSHWSPATLARFDHTSAALNTAINGRPDVFVRTDPRAELIRCLMHVKVPVWPADQGLRARLGEILTAVLGCASPLSVPARGCHGDFLPRHILSDGSAPLLCDVEESRYVAGPLDIAHYVLGEAPADRFAAAAMTEAVNALTELVSDPDDRRLGLQWMLAQVLFIGVRLARRGDAYALDRLVDGLENGVLIDALRS